MGSTTLSAAAKVEASVGGNIIQITNDGKIAITAGVEVMITVGGSSITLHDSEITIASPTININGSKINSISTDGHTIKGSTVKINWISSATVTVHREPCGGRMQHADKCGNMPSLVLGGHRSRGAVRAPGKRCPPRRKAMQYSDSILEALSRTRPLHAPGRRSSWPRACGHVTPIARGFVRSGSIVPRGETAYTGSAISRVRFLRRTRLSWLPTGRVSLLPSWSVGWRKRNPGLLVVPDGTQTDGQTAQVGR